MSRNRELAKNTLLLGVSKVATQMLLFLLIPIYTNNLTPKSYGSIDLIMTYVTLAVPFLTIQLEFAAFRFAIDNRNDEDKLSEILSTIFSVIMPFAIVSLGIFFVISLFINIPYVILISANILTSVILATILQFSRGIGKTKVFAIASIFAGITTIISTIIFIVLLNWNASSILLSATLSNIVTTIYLIFAIGLKSKIHLKYVNADTRKELLSYSIPLLPNNTSWWILNVSDRTIIALFLGVAANGIYAIAYKFAFIPNILFSIFNMSWLETASVHIKSPDKDSYFSEVFNNTLLIYSCIAALFISAMPLFFPFLVGEEFSSAYRYIPILVLGGLAQALVGMYSSIYIAEKKTKEVARTSGYAAVINILVNLALIYFVGLYAAAISTLVAFLALLIHRHYDVQKYVKIQLSYTIIVKISLILIPAITLYYLNLNIANYISVLITIVGTLLLNRILVSRLVYSAKEYAK